MNEIFNLNNKFYQTIGKIVDCFFVSILWCICCIPVVTAGAATTALYYTVNKVILHGRSYVWKEYWHSFRSNFKQATISWLILLVAAIILGMDAYIMYQYSKAGEKIGSIYTAFLVLLAFEAVWGNYIFSYIARFENTTKQVFRNTIFMMIINLPWSAVILITLAIACYAVYVLVFSLVQVNLIPILVLVVPAVYMIAVNQAVERVYLKYMSEEDRQAEEERNRSYTD